MAMHVHNKRHGKMTRKRILWKDIRQSFAKSKWRFISIMCLMALGSFALVGLKVTGPDMRSIGSEFFDDNNLADVAVISEYGLSDDDLDVIAQTPGLRQMESGYFKDMTIRDSDASIRVFSEPEQVSRFAVTEGRMPENDMEIVLNNDLHNKFAIGSSVKFDEKADSSGAKVLKNHEYQVVGFVNASEIVSNLNMGQSQAGSGELKGYAVVAESAFDSNVHMIARLTFDDTQRMNQWNAGYRDAVQHHKDDLMRLLASRPEARAASIRANRRGDLDKAQDKVDDAKQQLDDAKRQLDDGKQQLDGAKQQLRNAQAQARTQAATAQAQIASGEGQISSATSTLSGAQMQLDAAASRLQSGQAQLS